MENGLRFEKVGDVTQKYSFLEMFMEGENEAVMIITISEDAVINYKIYRGPISLTGPQWRFIMDKAERFLRQEVMNEISFDEFMDNLSE